MKPVDEAPHLLSAFRQLHPAGRRGLVRQIMDAALRRGGEEAALLCERMIEVDEFDGEFAALQFAQIVAAYAALDPDLDLGRRRRSQLRSWSALAADERRTYTETDRERWRALDATEFAHHSARRAASLIVARERLPEHAFESVRRALPTRKRVTPSD